MSALAPPHLDRAPAAQPVALHAVARDQFWLRIDAARCTGCGWCVAACPLDLLSLASHQGRKTSVLARAQACTACRLCEARCLFGAIAVQRQDVTISRSKSSDLANRRLVVHRCSGAVGGARHPEHVASSGLGAVHGGVGAPDDGLG